MARTGLRSVGPRDRAVGRGRPKKAMPGPTSLERAVVLLRAGGRCEVCGVTVAILDDDRPHWVTDHSFHHRQPRGSGGTRDPEANTPPRLLLLCGTAVSGCHGLIEFQRVMAKGNGWLVPRPTDPAAVPVELYVGRVFLTLDGTYQEA